MNLREWVFMTITKNIHQWACSSLLEMKKKMINTYMNIPITLLLVVGWRLLMSHALTHLISKLQYFGQLMQKANSLEKTLMLGKIEGRRRTGWQRMRWLDSITDLVDMSLNGQTPGESGGQGSLACCFHGHLLLWSHLSMGSQRVGCDWATQQWQHNLIIIIIELLNALLYFMDLKFSLIFMRSSFFT